MPRNRFVDPVTVKLPLTDEDWIEVKTELNVGEQKSLEAAGVRRTGGDIEIIWQDYHIKRAAVWITDWSFHDKEGVQQEYSEDAIRALKVDAFKEIQDALSRHIEAVQAEQKRRGEDESGELTTDIAVMKFMGWSWQQYLEAPSAVRNKIIELVNEAKKE